MEIKEQLPGFRPGTAEAMQAEAAKQAENRSYAAGTAAAGYRKNGGAIGEQEVREAAKTLRKYKEGKANLERRIIENEKWYRLRHWECMRRESGEPNAVEPVSGWLFNSIANKHADAMDNIPTANILPREESDKPEAEKLTSILPVVLEQTDWEGTYDVVQEYKLKGGTGVYGVFWDADKLNGLGDVTIKKVDILNLFWESGIEDIQDSRNVFHVALVDNDLLMDQYPQCRNRIGPDTGMISTYDHDDTIDTTNKSAVIDWYYKKRTGGKTVLHYCKFVADVVLFASENEPGYEDGWYAHGMYPFVFDSLYRVDGTPCGFGLIDVAKSAQEYIDRGNQAMLQNMEANARPRHFIRSDGSVNEAEYADYTKEFVHVDGSLGQDSIMPIQGKVLNSIYMNLVQLKVDELKEVTGNRDISTGGTSSGVTAASAIAAMQEAGSKLSRDSNKRAYRAFKKVCNLVVELIRQFYDLPRQFRIIGNTGTESFIDYSNGGMLPQQEGDSFRLPVFDLDIVPQKQSPYSKMSQNELALQFYSAGFFNPQMADQALACLDMMDFDRKNFVMDKIRQNGTMFQMIQQLQAQVMGLASQLDQLQGSNLAQQAMMQMGGAAPMPQGEGAEMPEDTGESSVTKNARQRVADSTAPT